MSAHLVKGDDPILRSDTLEALVADLIDADDRSLAVEDLTVPGRSSEGEVGGADVRQAVVAAAVHAAQCPPFMTGVRVVLLRDIGNLAAADVAPLVEYLADPLDTTELVLVAGGGKIPDALTKALRDTKAAEHGVAGRKVEDVLSDALEDAGIALRADAVAVVKARVGEEAGRIPAIVEVLAATYGPDVNLSVADIEPYLGNAGSVPAYLLTGAIEEGDVAAALELLHRLLTATGPQQPRPMHPLQVLAMLHNWMRRVARLDDPEIGGTEDAVAALGGRVHRFPAGKALDHSRRIGTEGIREAYGWLAQADLDLKGERAIPEDAVMEVLVARLAAQAARAGARPRKKSGTRSRR
jgi:DNA polymerase III subunit delta